jgi:uncharacterized protein (DUF983 family)
MLWRWALRSISSAEENTRELFLEVCPPLSPQKFDAHGTRTVIAIGYCLGPVIGGAFAQKLEWEWCFWVTIPVSFLATCVVAFILLLKPVQGEIRR